MSNRSWLFYISILSLVAISGCVEQQLTVPAQPTTESDFVVAKLETITGGDFVPSAVYYEGKLILSDTTTGEKYSIFACSESWTWVKEGACYRFSLEDVSENVEQHKFSMELSGCYVGTLTEVSC